MALGLVVVGVLCRMLPHPANFAPVTAIALFAGVTLRPALALTLPLLIMVASDLLIGPHPLFAFTWGAFFIAGLIGCAIKDRAGGLAVFLGTSAGSLIFFVLTNLAVFLFQDMYPKDFPGLVQCYVMALPFFKNTLLGDLFFSFVFFSSFVLLKNAGKKTAEAKIRG